MNCSDAKLLLESAAAGTLVGADRSALDHHLVSCEGCRLELELTRAVLGVAPTEPQPFGERPLSGLAAGPENEGPELPGLLASPPPNETELLGLEDPGKQLTLQPETPPPAFQPSPPPGGVPSATPGGEASLADLGLRSPALGGDSAGASGASGSHSTGPASAWDFEPVDPPRPTSPPEGSLTFAEEALSRGRSRRAGEGARLTLILWSAGGVAGIALLAISVWMAMARGPVRRPEPGPTGAAPMSAPVASRGEAPTPTQAPAPSDAAPPWTSATTGEPPAGENPPATAAPQANGAQAPAPIAPALGEAVPVPAPQPLASVKSAEEIPPGPSRAPAPKSVAPPKKSSVTPRAPSSAKSVRSTAPIGNHTVPAPTHAPPPSTPEETEFDGSSEAAPSPELPSGRSPSLVFDTPRETSTPPASAVPEAAPAPPTSSGEPIVPTPIDRLHLATVSASKDKDLPSLRKLKSSWKSFLSGATGPDRSRAKRELADCLWSIQEITGRASDRREALAAYREYILYAPAGGADARTVARMRHLEDILSDSR